MTFPPFQNREVNLTFSNQKKLNRQVTTHLENTDTFANVFNKSKSSLSSHCAGFDKSLNSSSNLDDSNELQKETKNHEGLRLQILRSISPWSNGMPRENSIYKAYIEAILNAKDFIYIENQFFVTSTGVDSQHRSSIIENRIGQAIVRRILRAAKEQKTFKVYVILPVRPGFECDGKLDLWSPDCWVARCQIQLQAESICRGPNSILSGLSSEVRDWREYIGFYSLRGGDFTSDGKFHAGQIYIHSKVMIVDDEI